MPRSLGHASAVNCQPSPSSSASHYIYPERTSLASARAGLVWIPISYKHCSWHCVCSSMMATIRTTQQSGRRDTVHQRTLPWVPGRCASVDLNASSRLHTASPQTFQSRTPVDPPTKRYSKFFSCRLAACVSCALCAIHDNQPGAGQRNVPRQSVPRVRHQQRTSYCTSYEKPLPTTTCQAGPNFLSIVSFISCNHMSGIEASITSLCWHGWPSCAKRRGCVAGSAAHLCALLPFDWKLLNGGNGYVSGLLLHLRGHVAVLHQGVPVTPEKLH
jgi:hypothetical protein